MSKKILLFKYNIIYSIVLLAVLSLNIIFYSGVKEGYFNIFLLAFIIAPMLILTKHKTNLKADFIFTVTTILILALYAVVFWKYKDGHLLSLAEISQIPEEARSQFSFENELKLSLLLVCSSVSALVSLFIRFAYSKFKIIKA